MAALAIIGGSGLYQMPGLQSTKSITIETPFGSPSAPIILGEIEGVEVAFLARHGIGHWISPSEVNYRANIYALKTLGVERIVSISACGSLREDYYPGELVIPDQLFDFTKGRARTFFGEGLVAHISIADPFCAELSNHLLLAVQETGVIVHDGGAFITIEGPRFSTRIESNSFRSWGMSIIGMTTSPEAFLAREAEMCYSVMAHITDYDVWRIREMPVTVDQVVEILKRNTEIAEKAICNLIPLLAGERTCSCQNALASSLLTDRSAIPNETLQRLGVLIDKYIK